MMHLLAIPVLQEQAVIKDLQVTGSVYICHRLAGIMYTTLKNILIPTIHTSSIETPHVQKNTTSGNSGRRLTSPPGAGSDQGPPGDWFYVFVTGLHVLLGTHRYAVVYDTPYLLIFFCGEHCNAYSDSEVELDYSQVKL